jgi:hypothetical protein
MLARRVLIIDTKSVLYSSSCCQFVTQVATEPIVTSRYTIKEATSYRSPDDIYNPKQKPRSNFRKYALALSKNPRAMTVNPWNTPSEKFPKPTEPPTEDFSPLDIPLEPREYVQGSSKRIGLIGIKQGMLSHFDTVTGVRFPVTVLWFDRCQVLWSHSNGRLAAWTKCIDVGSSLKKNINNVHAVQRAYFKKCGVENKRHVKGFRVSKDGLLPPGKCYKKFSWAAKIMDFGF